MRKKIIVYDKNSESLGFLKAFFEKRDDYSVTFIKDKNTLLKQTSRIKPDVVVVGSPDSLSKLKPVIGGHPVIAMVSGNITDGISSVIKCDIESYIISPFYKEDFEHKLNMAIRKKGWFENIAREKKDLETVIELIYLVSSTLNPEEILYFVVRKISEIIDVTRCSVISIPVEEQKYAYVVSTFENQKLVNIKLELKKYPEIRKALSTKSAVVIEDALSHPLMRQVRPLITPLNIRSIMVLPIIFRNEVIGTLFLRTSRKGNAFTEREVRLCSAIANASANALYNAFTYKKLSTEKTKLEQFAITDYLTGIYNIRYFYHRLDDEFGRAQRYNTALSCIMFDIDYFKKINDTHGHRIGDMVLREFAQRIKERTRKSDVFARYGGEEFIMLMPNTSKAGALAEAERLRNIIKRHKFASLKNKRGITVSIGISSCPSRKIKQQDDLITLADNALFEAKNSGRDQIRSGA